MQYAADTPEGYIQLLEDDWRKTFLLDIRQMILLNAGISEKIEYKMLAFGNKDNTLFHLNAQKNYVSLYVGDTTKIDPKGELLDGLNIGKGCIRFSKSTIPQNTTIQKFISKAYEFWAKGKDLSC
jgi:uncharacterized protein YdhG (YjbR/CyaY superfamily)